MLIVWQGEEAGRRVDIYQGPNQLGDWRKEGTMNRLNDQESELGKHSLCNGHFKFTPLLSSMTLVLPLQQQ